MLSIFKTAKKNLIIIDGFADNVILDMISKIRVPVTLIVKEKSILSKTDINKYNSQYDNLKIINSNSFHDRYIIIDEDIFYHCGTPINYAGKRAFGIDILGDMDVKSALLNKVKLKQERR